MALWNLAFNDKCRREIIASAGVVDALREVWRTSESGRTKEAAKVRGCHEMPWAVGLLFREDQIGSRGARMVLCASCVSPYATLTPHVPFRCPFDPPGDATPRSLVFLSGPERRSLPRCPPRMKRGSPVSAQGSCRKGRGAAHRYAA